MCGEGEKRIFVERYEKTIEIPQYLSEYMNKTRIIGWLSYSLISFLIDILDYEVRVYITSKEANSELDMYCNIKD